MPKLSDRATRKSRVCAGILESTRAGVVTSPAARRETPSATYFGLPPIRRGDPEVQGCAGVEAWPAAEPAGAGGGGADGLAGSAFIACVRDAIGGVRPRPGESILESFVGVATVHGEHAYCEKRSCSARYRRATSSRGSRSCRSAIGFPGFLGSSNQVGPRPNSSERSSLTCLRTAREADGPGEK